MKLKLLMLVTAGLTFANVVSAAPPYSKGSRIHTTKAYQRVGGDRVIFGYAVSRCDESSLKSAAIKLKNRAETDRWDDKWYAFSVTRNMCLMIGWYNLDTSKFGWAAAQNQPSSWSVRSNSKTWQTLGNDSQRKYSYTINGQTVDLDLFNPKNEGALTGDDILISFGY